MGLEERRKASDHKVIKFDYMSTSFFLIVSCPSKYSPYTCIGTFIQGDYKQSFYFPKFFYDARRQIFCDILSHFYDEQNYLGIEGNLKIIVY